MTEAVGVGYAVLAAVGLAAQALAVRLGTDTHGVGDVIAVVFAVNLAVLVPVAVVVGYPEYGLTPRAAGAFAAAGLLGSLLGRACYFEGIARLGASRAEPLKALLPVFSVVGAVLALGERVTPLLLAGVGVVVVGVVAVATEARASPVTATGRQFRVDVAFPVLAALLYGVDPVFTAVGLAAGTPPAVGVGTRAVAAAAGFGAYLAWRGIRGERTASVAVTGPLLVAGVANTGYLLAYYAALSRARVVVVTPVLATAPLFVVAGAALFLRGAERVTPRLAAGTALVVAGVVLVVAG